MKTSHVRISLLVASGLLLAAPSVIAADDQKDPAAKFQSIDTDGDGRISQSEFTSAKREKKHWWNRSSTADSASAQKSPELFTQLDANRDGFLSSQEFEAGYDGSSRGSTRGVTPSDSPSTVPPSDTPSLPPPTDSSSPDRN